MIGYAFSNICSSRVIRFCSHVTQTRKQNGHQASEAIDDGQQNICCFWTSPKMVEYKTIEPLQWNGIGQICYNFVLLLFKHLLKR